MEKKIPHSVFDYIAERHKLRIAVEDYKHQLTYDALKILTDHIGNVLLQTGLKKSDIVGVLMESCAEYPAGIIGTNKAGGVFMPLDLSYPVQRIQGMLADTMPKHFIVKQEDKLKLIQYLADVYHENYWMIVIDIEASAVNLSFSSPGSEPNLVSNVSLNDISVAGDDPCYLLFTSGSTGKPKGILGRHKSLSHFIHWEAAEFDFQPGTKVSQLAPLLFDVSLRDIFLPLLMGGTLVIPKTEARSEPLTLLTWLLEKEINLMHTVPTVFRELMRSMRTIAPVKAEKLKYILLAGEPLYGNDVKNWREFKLEHVQLVNLYGPSETTLAKLFHRIDDHVIEGNSIIPLGTPISNTVAFLVKEDRLCEIGEVGEIFIKTPFMSLGYFRDDKLTQEKFVQNPLNSAGPDIVFRTGDLGKYLSGQKIAFAGRVDSQVKIRGNRVELLEVELAIRKIIQGNAAIVAALTNVDNELVMVAYYQSDTKISEQFIHAKLSEALPSYMIPSIFIWLKEFPLLINGKVDKKALPKPEELLYGQMEFEAPRTEVEQVIALIWSEMLGLKKVGVNNSFFTLGGHSLLATRVVSALSQHFGVELPLRIFFNNPTIRQLAVILEVQNLAKFSDIKKASEKEYYDLSPSQRRIWVLSNLKGLSQHYNISNSYKFGTTLSIALLEKSMNRLIEKYEILRTAFVIKNGEPKQNILATAEFLIDHYDFTSLEEDEKRQKIKQTQTHFSQYKFDMSAGELFKLAVIHVADSEVLVIFVIHHIISDAFSVNLLTSELMENYTLLSEGQTPSTDSTSIQYRDFSEWQLRYINSSSSAKQRRYWIDQFNPLPPAQNFPTDFPRKVGLGRDGAVSIRSMHGDSFLHLQKAASEMNATIFMVVLSAVKCLASLYSRDEDIVVGVASSGRNHQQLEKLIGLFLNILPIRTMVQHDSPFDTLVDQVKNGFLRSLDQEAFPFDELVSALHIEHDFTRNPLFDIMVDFQEEFDYKHNDRVRVMNSTRLGTAAKYDLTFFFFHTGKSLEVMVEYNVALFRESTIQRMVGHLFNLIEQVCLAPSTKIKDIELLAPKEKSVLKQFATAGGRAPLIEHTYIELFNNIVRQSGDRIAIEFGNNQISYWQLEDMSEAIASQLRSLGIGAGEIVGLMSQRSAYTVAALLGIMKSGAAFLPVDVRYPKERKQYILSESGAKALLIESNELLQAIDIYSGPLLSIDNVSKAEVADRSEQVTTILESTAYVIYTSGTTGNPKGVAVGQKSFVNYIEWANRYYFADQSDQTFAFFTSLSFDLTLTSIFTTLLRADKICIYENEDPATTLRSIFEKTSGITAVKMTPSHVRLLEGLNLDGTNVSTVILGGEQLEERQVEYLHGLNPGMTIYNEYGPTEATVGCTIKQVTPEQMVTIGIPITGAEIYILDTTQKQTAVGVNGEIYIGGNVLAKEYLNEPALTASKFIHTEWGRLYKTGDTGKWLDNGEIALSGRNDDQVKIRGFRVELTEIEKAVIQYTRATHAVCIYTNEQLTTFITRADPINENEMLAALADRLPFYMMPSKFVQIPEFPLTRNGKIDREKLLKDLDVFNPVVNNELMDMRTQALLKIVQNVLQRSDIRLSDNFFLIGGHSLMAVRLVLALKLQGFAVELETIFSNPVIGSLLRSLRETTLVDEEIPSLPEHDLYHVSSSQYRIWLHQQVDPASIVYNQFYGFNIEGTFSPATFEKAIVEVIERYEVLRTGIVVHNGTPFQKIGPPQLSQFVFQDFSSDEMAEEKIEKLTRALVDTPFDLQLPMFNVVLLKKNDIHHILTIRMHHMISDGWSLNIILGEIVGRYRSLIKGERSTPLTLRIQYKDFSHWHNAFLNSEKAGNLQNYWRKKLHGSRSYNIKQDRTLKEKLTGTGRNKKISISKIISDEIRQLCAQEECSLFMFVTTCLKIVFCRYIGSTDYILGTPLSGRVHHELENQVGNFINLVPLRTCFEADDTFQSAMDKVKSTILESHQSERYPFDRILEDINYQITPGKFPLFDVVITSQTFDNSVDQIGFATDIHIEPYTVENPTAQFPLSLDLFDNQEQIHFLINYDTSFFSEKWIADFLRHIQQFIQNAITHPESNYRSLSPYNPEEEVLIDIFREKYTSSSGHLFDIYTPIHEVLTMVGNSREIVTDIRKKFEVVISENDLKACTNCSDLLAHIHFLKNGPVGFSISRSEKIQS